MPKQAVYTLTKGAVFNFTRTVAAEAGPYRVRANAVCPGFIETALGEAFFEQHDDPEKARERMEAQYPLKRPVIPRISPMRSPISRARSPATSPATVSYSMVATPSPEECHRDGIRSRVIPRSVELPVQ